MLEFHFIQKLGLGKDAGPDDVDVPDAGSFAFLDVDADGHPVARQLVDVRFDGGPVAALGDVLPLQFQANPLQSGLLEDLALAQALFRQSFQQRLGLDRLVAFDLYGFDGRAFRQDNHQHVVVPGHADVVEIAGSEQQPQQLADGDLVQGVAHLHGQNVEQGAGRDPLQALQADVRDGERLGLLHRAGQPQPAPAPAPAPAPPPGRTTGRCSSPLAAASLRTASRCR